MLNVQITKEAREEARRNPNGYVYVIEGKFAPDDPVPPDAIVGAWKVDGEGEIVGEFIANPNYQRTKKFD
jgi:hypothetical protein